MRSEFDMFSERLRIRYDGPALATHSIDVSVVGPSLTGLGELLSASNSAVNGPDVKVRVVMNADIEANCVTLDFEVLQSIMQAVKNLLGDEHVQTAKELFEWLGIISFAGGSAGGTVWWLYKWVTKNRKPGQKITTRSKGDEVTIVINDNVETTVNVNVFKIASEPKVKHGFLRLLSPLTKEGIEEIVFTHRKSATKIEKSEALPVLKASEVDLDFEINPQIVTGHIVIHSPVFSKDAKTWKFKWNNRVESIDISETNIFEQVESRGGVAIGDAFQVKMEMIEKPTSSGTFKHYFKVIEVLGFSPYVERQRVLPIASVSDQGDDGEVESDVPSA